MRAAPSPSSWSSAETLPVPARWHPLALCIVLGAFGCAESSTVGEDGPGRDASVGDGMGTGDDGDDGDRGDDDDDDLDGGPGGDDDDDDGRDAGTDCDAGAEGDFDGGPCDGADGDDPDAGARPCPEEGCDDLGFAGSALPACCPTDGSGCGYDLTGVAALAGLNASEVSCLPTEHPGSGDDSCPSRMVLGVVSLGGCCLPSGECGFLANLSGLGLPNLGCVDYAAFAGAGTPDDCTP